MRAFSTLSVLTVLSFAAIGCGPPSVDEICDRYGDECSPTAEDLSDCKQDLGEIEQLADQEGCSAEFDDYLSCIDALENICSVEEGSCLSEAFVVADCTGQLEDQN